MLIIFQTDLSLLFENVKPSRDTNDDDDEEYEEDGDDLEVDEEDESWVINCAVPCCWLESLLLPTYFYSRLLFFKCTDLSTRNIGWDDVFNAYMLKKIPEN